MGNLGRFFGESGSGHQAERLSRDTVEGNLQYDTGGVALPTLFDMAVGSVVFHWLSLTMEDKATI